MTSFDGEVGRTLWWRHPNPDNPPSLFPIPTKPASNQFYVIQSIYSERVCSPRVPYLPPQIRMQNSTSPIQQYRFRKPLGRGVAPPRRGGLECISATICGYVVGSETSSPNGFAHGRRDGDGSLNYSESDGLLSPREAL